MTVCIAALADYGKSLVMVCDSMLSTGEVSGDRIADKLYPLTSPFQWWAMVAGDVAHVPAVVNATVHNLFGLSDSTNEVDNIERAAAAAYQGIRMRHAEDLVLSPIGMTIEQFRDRTEWQPYLVDRLYSVDLGCQLLVAGFDFNGDGCLFTVDAPGVIRNHSLTGWASIGSGSHSAMSTLLHHSVNHSMEISQVLYHACEAKFMAESAEGVGEHTRVKIASGAGVMTAIDVSEEMISVVRRAWEEDGKPHVPSGLLDELRKQVAKFPGDLFPPPTTAT